MTSVSFHRALSFARWSALLFGVLLLLSGMILGANFLVALIGLFGAGSSTVPIWILFLASIMALLAGLCGLLTFFLSKRAIARKLGLFFGGATTAHIIWLPLAFLGATSHGGKEAGFFYWPALLLIALIAVGIWVLLVFLHPLYSEFQK